MKTIYKYTIPSNNRDEIDHEDIVMPKDAQLLHCAIINRISYLWAEVDCNEIESIRRIYLIGTGRRVPYSAEYLTTVIDGPFVFHIYDGGQRFI